MFVWHKQNVKMYDKVRMMQNSRISSTSVKNSALSSTKNIRKNITFELLNIHLNINNTSEKCNENSQSF